MCCTSTTFPRRGRDGGREREQQHSDCFKSHSRDTEGEISPSYWLCRFAYRLVKGGKEEESHLEEEEDEREEEGRGFMGLDHVLKPCKLKVALHGLFCGYTFLCTIPQSLFLFSSPHTLFFSFLGLTCLSLVKWFTHNREREKLISNLLFNFCTLHSYCSTLL